MIFSKVSSLRSCSILQASAAATSSLTPRAAADACKMEHDLSEETYSKIKEHASSHGMVLPPDPS